MRSSTVLCLLALATTCNWPSSVTCSGAPPSSSGPPPSGSPPPSSNPPPSSAQEFGYVVYYPSWSEPWASSAAATNLAKLPAYTNHVILSFMDPSTTYSGGVTFTGTGIEFSSSAQVIKDAIALLKSNNPDTKVLVAVGGDRYTGWDNFNADGIARFVEEFGLDGVDIDYEPTSTSCTASNGKMSCSTDDAFISFVKALRAALPRPHFISFAGFSVGAYGLGEWANAQPASMYTGISITMMQTVGDQVDAVNIMSYDAGDSYSPTEALDAYSNYMGASKCFLGMEVAPEGSGGHVITLNEVDELAAHVKEKKSAGLMLWSLYKAADSGTPTYNEISVRSCKDLDMSSDCTDPVST